MLKAIDFFQQKLVPVLNLHTFLIAGLLSALSACSISITSDEQSVQAPTIKANCQYVDPAVLSSVTAENPYDNGYRLVKETYESNIYPSTTTYKYDSSSNTVEVLEIRIKSGGKSTTTQYLDNSGRLTGGDHVDRSPLVNFGHSYQIGYDDAGRVVSFDRDGARSYDFIYEQGRLIEITRPDQGALDETKEFNYDDAGNLVSVYDSRINASLLYTCNDQNQITSLHLDRDGVTNGYYTFKYDDNGNLSELKSFSEKGYLFFTSTFEYELSTVPTFNLWRLRTSMGLLPAIDLLVH